MTIVTRESIAKMLENDNEKYVQAVIGRALIGIFMRQTDNEKSANDTNVLNYIGFAGCDARSGSLTAKYYMKHKRLEDWMVKRWAKIAKNGFPYICRYHRQLNEIAMEKAH